jgi:hypothetical protein
MRSSSTSAPLAVLSSRRPEQDQGGSRPPLQPREQDLGVPADAGTADRVIHSIEPIVADELAIGSSGARQGDRGLTTALPDDAELLRRSRTRSTRISARS